MPLFDFPERKHGLSLRGGTGAVGLLSSWPWLPSAPPVSCGLWEKENIWRAQESSWWLKGLPRNLPVAFSLKHHGVSILKHHPHPFFCFHCRISLVQYGACSQVENLNLFPDHAQLFWNQAILCKWKWHLSFLQTMDVWSVVLSL